MHRSRTQTRRCVNKHFPGSSNQCKQCQRATQETRQKKAHPEDGPAAKLGGGMDAVHILQEWEHFGLTLGYPPSRFARTLGHTPDGVRRVIAVHAERRPNDPRAASFAAAWERESTRIA
jgi:hypothetical protein